MFVTELVCMLCVSVRAFFGAHISLLPLFLFEAAADGANQKMGSQLIALPKGVRHVPRCVPRL